MQERVRRSAIGIGVAFACLSALPAVAQATHFRYAVRESSIPARYQARVSAPCRTGRVVGGGESNSGTYQQAELNSTIPFDSSDQNLVLDNGWQAYIDNYSNGSIVDTAYAICSSAAFTKHLSYVTSQVTVHNNKQGRVRPSCPAGKRVLGGGVFNVFGFNAGAVQYAEVIATVPSDGKDGDSKWDDAWAGRVINESGGNLVITGYAICAQGAFAGGLRYVHRGATVQPGQQGSMAAPCPGGTHVTGGGLGSPAASNDAVVNGTFPLGSHDGWSGYIDNNTVDPMPIDVYAVCHA